MLLRQGGIGGGTRRIGESLRRSGERSSTVATTATRPSANPAAPLPFTNSLNITKLSRNILNQARRTSTTFLPRVVSVPALLLQCKGSRCGPIHQLCTQVTDNHRRRPFKTSHHHPVSQVARPPSRQMMPRGQSGTPRLQQTPLPTTPGGGYAALRDGYGYYSTGRSPNECDGHATSVAHG